MNKRYRRPRNWRTPTFSNPLVSCSLLLNFRSPNYSIEEFASSNFILARFDHLFRNTWRAFFFYLAKPMKIVHFLRSNIATLIYSRVSLNYILRPPVALSSDFLFSFSEREIFYQTSCRVSVFFGTFPKFRFPLFPLQFVCVCFFL